MSSVSYLVKGRNASIHQKHDVPCFSLAKELTLIAIAALLEYHLSQIPLYYAEIKIIKGTDTYHVIPRTRPRRTN
ncbi:hypothetical protein PN499_13210 [Kamptonema animale CS-326]|jgi:hypothetical protein|uniref:DUF6972 family protein n=1 Tax=Kamptonema animale TaxID=92934 RepID=UPI00233081FE|nr:hypothetical protein [Kamptonema animale]MDB9512145.1 hypothetical protein [Kamptonema animale CS-326]